MKVATEVTIHDENIRAAIERGRDLTPVLNAQVGTYLIQITDQNFEAEGKDETWPPLKDTTQRTKMRQGLSSKSLEGASGELRASNVVSDVRNDSITIEYKDWKAPFHNYGTGIYGPVGSPYEIVRGFKGVTGFKMKAGRKGIMRPSAVKERFAQETGKMHPGIPRRKLIQINDSNLEDIRAIVDKYIREGAA